jgi:hypothetical protein
VKELNIVVPALRADFEPQARLYTKPAFLRPKSIFSQLPGDGQARRGISRGASSFGRKRRNSLQFLIEWPKMALVEL